jgi:hypothetical protein
MQNYPTYFSNCYNLWCHCQLPKIWVATRLDSSTAPFHNPRAPGPIIRSTLCINSWEILKFLSQFEQRILEARMLKSIWRHVTSQPLRSENLLSHQSQNVPCIHIVIVENLQDTDLTADEYLKHYKISRFSLLLWLVNHSIFHRYSIVADSQLQL